MAPVLQLFSSGVILAETFESYPNGWTFGASSTSDGSTPTGGLVSSPAHSGSGAFQLQDVNSALASAYLHFTKSVDLLTGANRVARLFRAAGQRYEYIQNPWTGAAMTQPSGTYYSTTFSCADGGGAYEFYAYDYGTHGFIIIEFNWPVIGSTAGHVYIDTYNDSGGGHETRIDCGPIAASGHHVYQVVWVSGKVTLYRDGAQIGQVSDSSVPVSSSYPGTMGPRGGGYTLDYWAIDTGVAVWNASCALGSQTLTDYDSTSGTGTLDNGFFDTGWVGVSPTGVQTIDLKLRLFSGGGPSYPTDLVQTTFDDLIVMLDKVITIQGLLEGQKVELLDASDVVKATVTCATTGVNVTIDVSGLISTAYGFSGHFLVYDTDGTTLLYTGSTAPVWGGDVYLWVPNQTGLATSANYTQVYRAGSGLSPGTATITATLTIIGSGVPVSGKALVFTPVLGSCSPASGTTDAYGNVTTTFTPSSSGGLGGVRVDYAGDSTYAPAVAQQLIDVYYNQIVVDPTKDFQVFLEGQELVVATGNYKLSADFLPQAFTLTSPQLNTPAGGWWFIAIYRRGVLEFSGRVLTRERVGGATPVLTLTGLDEKVMLQRRVIQSQNYIADPGTIIPNLLSLYPCGITAGIISMYGSVITLAASYENLYDALTAVANQTGWMFRLNADRTLDFAPSFDVVQSITITSGGDEATADYKEDWSKIDTTIYVVGSGVAASLVGSSTDSGATASYGLIEEVFLEKNLTSQGAVDLQAQTLIASRSGVIETITLDWIDQLPTGSYKPYDIVTVTDTDVELSGTYLVNTIQRDLTDAYLATLALTNRPLTIADALQVVRAVVKDLAVL